VDVVVSGPDEGERFDRGDRTVTIRADLPQLSANEIAFEPGFTVDPHRHPDHTDAFYVLEGEVEFTAGDETVVLGPGGFISSPPGARHGFRCAGGRARVLNLHTPGAGFIDGIRRTTAENG
jgi:quercetin dioxygenase-like cupin family protein